MLKKEQAIELEVDFGVEFSRLLDDCEGLRAVLSRSRLVTERLPEARYHGKAVVSAADALVIRKAVGDLQARLDKFRKAVPQANSEWRGVVIESDVTDD